MLSFRICFIVSVNLFIEPFFIIIKILFLIRPKYLFESHHSNITLGRF